MVDDGLGSTWPLEEIVDPGLRATVAHVTPRGLVVERFSQQTHPGLVQARTPDTPAYPSHLIPAVRKKRKKKRVSEQDMETLSV